MGAFKHMDIELHEKPVDLTRLAAWLEETDEYGFHTASDEDQRSVNRSLASIARAIESTPDGLLSCVVINELRSLHRAIFEG